MASHRGTEESTGEVLVAAIEVALSKTFMLSSFDLVIGQREAATADPAVTTAEKKTAKK